jgi:chemotaxis protein CheD
VKQERKSDSAPTTADADSKDLAAPPVASSVVYLHPGQIFVSEDPISITTILGSCVAICLWDPATQTGGMCHYVLPHGNPESQNALRFGNVAFAELIERFVEKQIAIPTLRAKIFGGSSLHQPTSGSRIPLGQQNFDIARKLLSAHGIAPPVEDVGGQRGRKLIFHLASGDAWVKAL